jgi:hypothetical protein
MESLQERVEIVLEREFPKSEIDLEPREGGKVGGFLVWRGFESVEQIDRQHKLWEVLRKHISEEDRLAITAIFAITPLEQEVMREEQEIAG